MSFDPDELQDLYDVLDMPGWQRLMNRAKKKREDRFASIITIGSLEELRSAQAEINTLDWLLDMPDAVRRQYRRAQRALDDEGEEGG